MNSGKHAKAGKMIRDWVINELREKLQKSIDDAIKAGISDEEIFMEINKAVRRLKYKQLKICKTSDT